MDNDQALGTHHTAPSPLQITELLEKILLDVPVVQLFVVKRVCRFWRDVIQESINLRRKMWLSPSNNQLLKVEQGRVFRRFLQQGLMLQTDVTSPETPLQLISSDSGVAIPVEVAVVYINPLLWETRNSITGVSLCRSKTDFDTVPVLKSRMPPEYQTPDWNGSIRLKFKNLGTHWPKNSCNKMLLTDPPCTMIVVYSQERPYGSPHIRVRNSRGVTLHDVLIAAIKCHQQWSAWRTNNQSKKNRDQKAYDYSTNSGNKAALETFSFGLGFGTVPF